MELRLASLVNEALSRLRPRPAATAEVATAIEYGLIAAGIAMAIIPALNGVGSILKVKFTTISTSLK
jgi:pilus assembly protein Flp/PilA